MSVDTQTDNAIELNDNEPIIFTDNPDGSSRTEAEIQAEVAEREGKSSEDAGEGAATAAPEAASDTNSDGTAPGEPEPADASRRPKRNRKDYQERINKLVRAQHEAEERAAAAEAARELAYQELQDLRTRYRIGDPKVFDEQERRIAEVKRKAIESMDLETYDAANREELELRDARRQAQAEQQRPKSQPKPQAEPLHASAEQWLSRNPWVTDRSNEALTAQAVRIESRLMQSEGLTPGEKLYQRLDEELAKLPEFDAVRGVEPDDESEPAPRAATPPADPVPAKRPVVAPPSRGDVPPPVKADGNARQLTDHDKRTMRLFKLDPGNPQHRASYLKYR